MYVKKIFNIIFQVIQAKIFTTVREEWILIAKASESRPQHLWGFHFLKYSKYIWLFIYFSGYLFIVEGKQSPLAGWSLFVLEQSTLRQNSYTKVKQRICKKNLPWSFWSLFEEVALLAVQWCFNVKFILLCDHFYVIWVFIEIALKYLSPSHHRFS